MNVRALLWEDDQARAVAERLREAGFDATVVRDRLAGEDDDGDQPWAVLTDAPEAMVDLLLDEFDGWLDDAPEEAPPADRQPLGLPDAPRRVKGHFRGE